MVITRAPVFTTSDTMYSESSRVITSESPDPLIAPVPSQFPANVSTLSSITPVTWPQQTLPSMGTPPDAEALGDAEGDAEGDSDGLGDSDALGEGLMLAEGLTV